jgi:leader peptidase (prepilin peptidase)/N-methyltransferase
MPEWYFSIYAFVFGAIIGSFLNVLIWRLPRHENFITKRSHCPHCDAMIRWYDNIPMISYLILGGRCRHCKAPISAQYPLVEIATGLLFLVSFRLYGLSYHMALVDVIIAMLLVVTIVDFRHYIIPDMVTIPGIVIGLAFSLVNPLITPLESVIGLVAGGASLYLLAVLGDFLFKKESLGGGDIKLAAMLGAWLGWQNIIIVFFGGALLGLMFAIIQIARSKEMRAKRLIPFGPFLSLAAVIALFWGEKLITFYIQDVLLR